MIEEPPVLTLIRGAPRPSETQIAAFRGVATGFVCDAMDGAGALDTAIAPLTGLADPSVHAVGPALVADNGPGEILATLAAVGRVAAGDIVVAAVGGWQGNSAAGDQVTGMLRNAGASGFVTDGPMRDYPGIVKVGLPAWCTGLNPNSPYATGPGTVGGGAEIGGRRVETGDMVVADIDGVVVVPYARIDAVIARLAEVRRLEDELEAKVSGGFRAPLDIDALLASGRATEV